MIIEKKKISDLIPAPYNPRQSTAKQEKHLKESLEKFGLVEPIIFNKQTGYIVGGHFRVRELKKLGIKEIECVIVDLNEADEKELNIRLNANTGGWDWDTLANDWDVVDLEAWGLEIPQFDERGEIDYSDKNKEVDIEDLEGLMTINLKYTEEDYWKVKEQLSKVAHTPEQAVWKLLKNE
jgi:ParB-like chromosome segregation protein Spo0J